MLRIWLFVFQSSNKLYTGAYSAAYSNVTSVNFKTAATIFYEEIKRKNALGSTTEDNNYYTKNCRQPLGNRVKVVAFPRTPANTQ